MIAKDTVQNNSDRKSIIAFTPTLKFSVLTMISLAFWWRPLGSAIALALHDEQYTHLLLILPVSVALIFVDWESPEPSSRASRSTGLSLLVVGAAVTVLVRSGVARLSIDEQLSLNMLALVVWWVGAFIACFGSLAFRRALFPFCFLFWIVPIPLFLLNSIVKLLQAGSVASAHLLFSTIGLPVAEDGTLLTIPGLTVEVARECSSIRSSLMLVVTTMVLTQTLLRSAWKKTLVIAVAIPLSVAKNGLRIFVLAMLATRVNRNYLTGRLHHQGGIIYFLIALAAIFLFIGLARHSDQKLRAAAITDR